MTDKEVIKQALELLKQSTEYRSGCAAYIDAVEDVDALLAQPEQEPVAILVSKVYWDGDELMAVPVTPQPAPAVQPKQDSEPVTNDEQATAFIEAKLWEAIDMYGTFPKAKVDDRTWSYLFVYAPQPAPAVQTLPKDSIKMYQCTGCGHLYRAKVSSCDCLENPSNTYNEWIAQPAPAVQPLTDERIYECERIATIRHHRHMSSIRGQQITPADNLQWHFAHAVITEFCRINGIGAPKE